jgi:hypothetical protein
MARRTSSREGKAGVGGGEAGLPGKLGRLESISTAPTGAGQAPDGMGAFIVGQKVEGRYKGKKKYFPAQIAQVNADGTFNLVYNDGDREENVPVELIRRSAPEGEAMPSARPDAEASRQTNAEAFPSTTPSGMGHVALEIARLRG